MSTLDRRAREHGTVAVMIVGFAVILILLTGVVVDASAAYLQRQRLDNLADGAALAGANEVRGAAIFEHGLGDGERVPLADDLAAQAVRAYLSESGYFANFDAPRVAVRVVDDAVRVELSARLDLPITVSGVTDARVGSSAAAVVLIDN